MVNTPTLAMLIPAYNAEQFLPRLFSSVADQSEPFDEIWVYDDCSTDETANVARKHGAFVVRGEVNQGCSFAKNFLLKYTRCDWVHFHDADDLLLPNFVLTARKWMNSKDVDAVAFGCEERDADSGIILSVSAPNNKELRDDPVTATIRHKINSISGIYRRDKFIAAGGYDLDPLVLYNEDQAMHARLARAGIKFGGDLTVTVVNLRRANSMSTANQLKCATAHYHVLLKTVDACKTSRQKRALAEQLWRVAGVIAAHLDWTTADAAAAMAIRLAGASAATSTPIFKALCRLSPRLALRAREVSIRLLRPETRVGYPVRGARDQNTKTTNF